MKFFLTFVFFLGLGITSACADECLDRFKAILTDLSDKGPVKIHATQEIKGGMTSTNYFYQVSTGHWMTEMIEPENMAWTLVHDNVMYTSADKGENWSKVRDMDSAENQEIAAANLAENVATARNAQCGAESLDGVEHEVIEATYDVLQNFKTENHFKYWVNPNNGWISKATYSMKADNFESFTTQLVEKAPGLELPTP